MKSKTDENSSVAEALQLDRSSRMKGRMKPYLAVMLVVIVGIGAVVAWRAGAKPTITQYKTEPVREGSLTEVVTATGTIQPTNTVDVGCEVSGTVKSVDVDYNTRVKVGQILAQLDTAKLEAQHTQAKAALQSAKAKVLQSNATVAETNAKLAQLRKVRELSSGKVPSQAEMDASVAASERARADLASATAAVTQAEASLQAVETDLSKSVIRSPINGIVLARKVEPGQTVAASFTTPVLFSLAEDLTKMDLHVNVDEADVGKIREGQKASFTVAAHTNRTFTAIITQARYGSSTTSGVVTYETVLKVDNGDLALRPGMTATADITVKSVEKATLIPTAALRFTPPVQEAPKRSGGFVGSLLPHPPAPAQDNKGTGDPKKKEQTVWILENGQLKGVPVTIGSSNGGVTEVLAGDARPGMSVVVDILPVSK
jgi:HlyD family secretion protein